MGDDFIKEVSLKEEIGLCQSNMEGRTSLVKKGIAGPIEETMSSETWLDQVQSERTSEYDRIVDSLDNNWRVWTILCRKQSNHRSSF